MGTGGVSAYAAVRGEVKAPEAQSASSSSLDDSQDHLSPDENPFLVLSENSGTVSNPAKSVVEQGSDCVSVRLEKGEDVAVVGLYSLWVKGGAVSLLGASIPASGTLHYVFAPITHAIPFITAIEDQTELEISTNDSGIRYMGDVSRHFAGIWEPNFISTPLSFHVLGYHSKIAQDMPKALKHLALDHWLPAIRQVLHRQRTTMLKVLVCGPKRAGKSTFCRVLINTILTMNVHLPEGVMKAFPHGVIFLDIDPGQPELAAPGIIYLAHVRAPLLGPSFANLAIPDMTTNVMLRMHYIGAYTPGESPSHYENCVADLLSLYRDYRSTPLIINTCGWNNGSGQTIISSALRGTVLTDIVDIREARNAPSHELIESDALGWQKVVSQIPSQPNRTPLKSGKDLREMQLQAYLHASGLFNGRILWDPLPVTMLRDRLPAGLDISNEIFMIVMLGHDLVPDYLADALEGSVVAIVLIKHDSSLYSVTTETEGTAYSNHRQMYIGQSSDGQLPYLVYDVKAGNPLDAGTTECLGLGLVSTVLSEKRQLNIKSPVSAAHIRVQVAKGYKVALVLARQQGLWPTLETILARGARPERPGSKGREKISDPEREYAEGLSAGTNTENDPAWQGFFEGLG